MSGPPRILHRADAGGRGDVDLGQEAVDHVDADEEEAALAQRRSEPGADFALALGEIGGLGHAAAHHVGAQIVGRRHPVDRAGELAIHQNDALVAVLHRGQEFLHHPRLAEHRGEQIVERAEIEVLGREPKHRLAAFAVKRLHDDVALLGAKSFDGVEVAGQQGRRHQIGKFGDEDFFRRVAHMARIVDHQGFGMDAVEHVGRRDIGEVERRVLAQQHHVEGGEVDMPRLAERDMVAGDIAHHQRPHRGRHFAVAQAQPVGRVIGQRVGARLRFQQQRERRIAADIDPLDRIHLHGDVQAHGQADGR